MSILFYAVRVLLYFVHSFVRWRAWAWDKIHRHLCGEVERVDHVITAANNPKSAASLFRENFFLLGLIGRCSTAATKWERWQRRNDLLTAWRAFFAGAKGRLVPYTLGHLDAAAVAVALDYLGCGPMTLAAGGLSFFVDAFHWTFGVLML